MEGGATLFRGGGRIPQENQAQARAALGAWSIPWGQRGDHREGRRDRGRSFRGAINPTAAGTAEVRPGSAETGPRVPMES